MSANVLLTESINMEVSNDIELPWYFATRDSSSGLTKKHQKIIFEYWVFSQKSYLNMGRFEKNIFAYQKFDFCIPKILYLHTK